MGKKVDLLFKRLIESPQTFYVPLPTIYKLKISPLEMFVLISF